MSVIKKLVYIIGGYKNGEVKNIDERKYECVYGHVDYNCIVGTGDGVRYLLRPINGSNSGNGR